MQSVITCLPIYNITKSAVPLICICRESKHVITLQGTVIRYRLRQMSSVPLYRLRHRLKHMKDRVQH